MNGAGSVLLVGAGGIGAPAAIALAAAGLDALEIADDDQVDETNLHRQILFDDADVGADKLDALARALGHRAPAMRVQLHRTRFLPDVALELARPRAGERRVIVDATDNFASRFLMADAAHLAGAHVVHAAAVRWHATVMAAPPGGRPCYRCLFEDLPRGDAPDCASAGVVGPVCGVAGALAAELALAILEGDVSAYGHILTYDGKRDVLRRVGVSARAMCSLCGAGPSLRDIDASRYVAAECAL